jgi:magnesium transporter
VGAQDSYLSAVSQKTNEVIRILAVVSTLIMPPTLIASIYGMNFKFMPELDWKWGYLFSIGLMVISVIIMIYIMKKKKWF